jgi:hypothetical protein
MRKMTIVELYRARKNTQEVTETASRQLSILITRDYIHTINQEE